MTDRRKTTTIGYIASVEGTHQRDGTPQTFWLQYDPCISGANPINWNSYAHEFGCDLEQMRENIKYAAGSWLVGTKDMSTLKIIKRKTVTVRTIEDEDVTQMELAA